MSKVFVLDTKKRILEPCHPATARKLLREGKAAIFKKFPFTIILKHEIKNPKTTDYMLSIDPGSKCTGLAITDSDNNIVAAFELHHRGNAIKKGLSDRAGHRRSRRTRKLRYRPARWQNRSRKAPVLTATGWEYQSLKQSSKGWIAPSLMSRVFNIHTWVSRLSKACHITKLAVEHVKFDTQLMQNPEISGVKYQRGTLYEAELWEYLLEKFGRKCFYCGAKDIPLEKEHILPKSKGGSNRASNLTISCRKCNQKKGNKHPNEIEGIFGKRVQSALHSAKKPLKDAASVNTIRWKIVESLKSTGLPVIYGTGGKTKYHRRKADLPKTHYYDAACVTIIPNSNTPHSILAIHAIGYGHRKDLGKFQTKQTAPGFKRSYTRTVKANSFQKLDIVKLKNKYIGSINSFDATTKGKPQKVRILADRTGKNLTGTKDGRKSGNISQLQLIQKRDGYAYQIVKAKPSDMHIPPINGIQLTLFRDFAINENISN